MLSMHRHRCVFIILFFIAISGALVLTFAPVTNAFERVDHEKAEFSDAAGVLKEVAYAYGKSGGRLLNNGNITEFHGSDSVNFTVAAGPQGDSASYETRRSMESIKEEITRRINRGDGSVRDEGIELIGKRSGPRRIDQICAIYDYLVDEKNWTYVGDWKGLDQFQHSNYTLKMGQDVGGLGKGDCDDFAILLGALVESVGATSRIIFAHGPAGGHAYAEVYLGNVKDPGSDVDRMVRWLRYVYMAEDINVQTDLATGDVWLNLDWWKEPGGAKHPGGPFFIASSHIQVYPDTSEPLEPLTPMNEPPIVRFNISVTKPNAGETITFNASATRDLDGSIKSYNWDFGDGEVSQTLKPEINHAYSIAGFYKVTLKVEDDKNAIGSFSQLVEVINGIEPTFDFSINPDYPKKSQVVEFIGNDISGEVDGRAYYQWYSDNETPNLLGHGKIFHYAFKNAGKHIITLKVFVGADVIYNLSKNIIVSPE
ncbi:PKD domain protein [uncultured archaeon]|nr:PKD domain protein [uncultured archaeon]